MSVKTVITCDLCGADNGGGNHLYAVDSYANLSERSGHQLADVSIAIAPQPTFAGNHRCRACLTRLARTEIQRLAQIAGVLDETSTPAAVRVDPAAWVKALWTARFSMLEDAREATSIDETFTRALGDLLRQIGVEIVEPAPVIEAAAPEAPECLEPHVDGDIEPAPLVSAIPDDEVMF